jgi:hypothetical protein
MFWPKSLLADPKRFLVKRFSSGVVSDLLKKESEITQGSSGLGLLWTPSALCHFDCSFGDGHRFLIFSFQSAGVLVDSTFGSSAAASGFGEARCRLLTAEVLISPVVVS